ncbi:SNF2-related protein [Rhodopseudomonas sp. HC1]|uniref:SNF2-related protein n=1 Tax=Rhodopseudomonas infernalis TaxID=2897386 RepID=UPI001EE79685|nr:SNF2-related protein [Rhodopseudomonas infernalis]MCG6204179.1 SNF2-related protein [Rhodopseudomonas infernalis]
MNAAAEQSDDFLAAVSRLSWRDGSADRSFGSLAFAGGRWVITDLEPHVAIRMKRIFPRLNPTQVGTFNFSDSDENRAELEWFIARYPLRITPDDRLRLSEGRMRFESLRGELEQVLHGDWQPSERPARLRDGVVLRPNQARAVEVGRKVSRLLIADDVGLGKTLAALATVMDDRFLPCALIVEPHVANQWLDEQIFKYTTLSGHIIAGTSPYVLPHRDCYIFKYSNFHGWVDVANTGRFRSVVFDEVQSLRHGRGTSKGAAADVFARNAVLRLGLSATPVFNYGGEMFNICDIIDPGVLGTREEFAQEWCEYSANDRKMVVKDPDALGTYLREINFVLRETGGGPPPNRIIHEVAYDEEAAAADEELARALAIKVLSGSFTERGQAARELDMMARHTTGVAKAQQVAAFCRILLDAGTPLILGGWHRDVYDIWMRELAPYKPILYTGSETVAEKDAGKKAFMEGRSDIIIMSLRSGAGLDGLQHRCKTVVHGELDWSPKVHEQLRGRLRPHARTDAIDEYYVVADGGSDPLIANLHGLKASQASGILDPGRALQAVQTDESRLKMLAQMYLDRGKA